jgi:RNA polymerase sigma factor (sigma-70 family)
LVRRYSAYVHAVIRRAFGLTDTDAEEVFQKVWLRVFSRLDQVRDEAAMRGWVRQITLNVARDHLAARRPATDEVLLEAEAEEATLQELDEALAVRQLLSELPEPCSEVLTRRFVADEKYATIAGGLGLTVGQVSGLIHRCLGRLRLSMERTEEGPRTVP